MLRLSERSRESIKTALAMTIAYAIALMMDWERPYWAAFAVAFVSLTTVGQSVNKAALRMCGTLMAMVIALMILSVSAQDRWLFIVLLSLFTSLCAYLMSASKVAYFWQVSAFVTAIICVDGGADPVTAFDTAIMRAQETGMGILVYTLVSLFLWPNTSRAAFFASATSLLNAQHSAFRHCVELSLGERPTTTANEVESAENQAQTSFATMLEAAESDTAEVMQQKAGWRTFARQSAAVTVALQYWRDSLSDIPHLTLVSAIPELERFNREISARFTAIENMQEQKPPVHEPASYELSIDLEALEILSHYDRAGLAIARSHMQTVDQATLALFETVARLRGFADNTAQFEETRSPLSFGPPDPDRLLATLRFALMQWSAFLAVIYVGDLPGGFALVTIVTALGIALVQVPGFKVRVLFKPTVFALLFAASIYIFVMPQLSNYLQLAPLIFAATFMICYLNFAPEQMLGRALGLALFSVICAISNEQNYNFLSVTTTAMMFGMLFVLLAASTHFPISMRAEDVTMRMLRRYFRSAQFLLSAEPAGWQRTFHAREVASLPKKLGAWVGHINPEYVSKDQLAEIQLLVSRLQLLSVRLSQLTGNSQSDLLAVSAELNADLKSWRSLMGTTLHELPYKRSQAKAPVDSGADSMSEDESAQRLRAKLAGTEGQILNSSEARNLYLLIGAYRGVAEALAACRDQAGKINWSELEEARFS